MIYSTDELKLILTKHRMWLNGEKGGIRANLAGANLEDANLVDANLRGANLEDANLAGANLEDANLRDANLRGVSLWGTTGNKCEIKSLQLETYSITYTSEVLQIGCQQHPIESWWEFDDNTISNMDDQALYWWGKWKDTLKGIIEKSPATPTGR